MTAKRSAIVNNPHGLHARPSMAIVEIAQRFQAKITIANGNTRANGKQIIDVMSLGAVEGTELIIEADGDDAEEAVDTLIEALQTEYHFD